MKVAEKIRSQSIYVMTSAGGLISSREFHPKDSLLSGPAGGVVGASAIARQSGIDQLISFDMGGTSTDVARYGGEYEYKFELEIGDAHIFSPALSIETVAAGGGSICMFDGYGQGVFFYKGLEFTDCYTGIVNGMHLIAIHGQKNGIAT